MREVAPHDRQVDGELADRLMLSFDRLERSEYRVESVFSDEHLSDGWPGDYVGRTILALARLAGATGRDPRYLDEILTALPHRINAQGYMGDVSDAINEQQLAGHGWLVSGLLAAHGATGDERALAMASTIVEGLYLPLLGRIGSYPTSRDTRVHLGQATGVIAGRVGEWRVSTDIGCAFIGLEGLVNYYERFPSAQLASLIDEMAGVFAAINLVDASMQLHASLTAARQILHFYNVTGHAELLTIAKNTYDLFRSEGITENYANYNWFGRPTWTEPCAIVDALIVAVELWRATGAVSYLEDAHHIYYNAIGYAQKPHGGFGLDNCVGAPDLRLKCTLYDVTWCCNMRGAVGLSRMADYAYLQTDSTITVPFYHPSSAILRFSDGIVSMEQTTGYPMDGEVRLIVGEATATEPKTLRLFIPSWSDLKRVRLHVNGTEVEGAEISGGFIGVTCVFETGDRIELEFGNGLHSEGTQNKHIDRRLRTINHGPLIVGSRDKDAGRSVGTLAMIAPGVYRDNGSGVVFTPINNVFRLDEDRAKADLVRVLFDQNEGPSMCGPEELLENN
jgi:hypothetical protein